MTGILCLGAGAIGSLVGARLHRAGVPVALVGRGEHLEAIRRDGLSVVENPDGDPDEDPNWGPRRPGPVRLPAFRTVSEALAMGPHPFAVILTVKAYDVDAAAHELATALAAPPAGPLAPSTPPTPTPVILCLENGLGSEELVARHFPEAEILAGAITLSVERPSPGRLRLLTDHGGITIGPFQPSTQPSTRASTRPSIGLTTAASRLTQALTLAGFRLRFHRRADAVKWSKVLLNLWSNATSAVFDAPPAQVVADPALFQIDWQAFREALRVMRAAGIPAVNLPGYPVRLLALLGRTFPGGVFRRLLGRKVAGGRGGKMPSLWLDLQARRGRSEVGFLNGAVAAAGARLGLSTPVNRALAQALEILTRQMPANTDDVNC